MNSTVNGTPRRSLVPVIGSFLLGGAFILILGFWLGGRDPAAGVAAGAPVRVVLIEPTTGAILGPDVPLVVETSAELRFMRDGWMAGRAHIHAIIDGVELMPGREDLEEVGPRRYRWVISGIQPGEREIRLVWSGPDHRPLPEGGAGPVTVEVR